MGINVNRIISLTFLVGGAFGGAAGVLYALKFTQINPYMGFFPGIKAFTAAVMGGIGNLTGALLGGMVLGMLETFVERTCQCSPWERPARNIKTSWPLRS